MIYWSTFSWEAFATLATGLSAVGAAVWVAVGQRNIAGRQTEILAKQVALADLEVRESLFERRLVVYRAARQLVAAILVNAAPPSAEDERAFLIAADEAAFLFGPAVTELLDVIWKDSCAYTANHKVQAANFKSTGSYGVGLPEKEHELFVKLKDHHDAIAKVMGVEMGMTV